MYKFTLTFILASLSMIGPVAIDFYLPSFGSIAKTLNVPEAAVQQTLSVYLIFFALSTLFVGTLSDSYGRKPVTVISLLLFAVTSVISAFAPNLEVLIICRAFQGIFGGVGVVIGQSIVKDIYDGPQARRMLSNILMIFSVAPAVAPIIGGILEKHFSWRANFLAMAIFTGVLGLACIFQLKETLPQEQRQKLNLANLTRGYAYCFTNPTFVFRALTIAFAFGGMGLYIASASGFIIHILGLTETDFGWLFVPMVCGMILGSSISAYFADKISNSRMIFIGMGIAISATIVNLIYNFNFVPKVPFASLPILFFTIGTSMSNPCINLMTLDLLPNRRGLASSASNFLRMAIFSMGSGIIAPLVFNSAHLLAIAMFTSYSCAIILWLLGLRSAKIRGEAVD